VEQSFVAWAKMRAKRLPAVKLGIGDDAAVLEGGEAPQCEDRVVTTDSLLDGAHFRLSDTDPRRIGRKLVNVNLSDLAAMGAEPEAFFLSLCLPLNTVGDSSTDALAAEIYEGVCEACEQFSVPLAGGDTNCWTGPLAVHGTAIGKTVNRVIWTREGAQPDDLIVVTGPLGGSLAGHHLDFMPRLDLARKLRPLPIHAAMDISDGLSLDLLRMSDASKCGAILELDKVPISAAAQAAAQTSGKDALTHALSDGEDFELLLAVAPADYSRIAEAIGPEQAIICGTFSSRTGLWAKEKGKLRQLTTAGYIHGEVTEVN
jgi:thiamine-monophosphate kinase